MTTTSVRGLALRLHFYAGLLIGPFVLVAALTGVLYALTPQLESLVYADKLRVAPSSTELPLSQQVRSALDSGVSGALVAVRPAAEPGATTRVLFSEPGLGEGERRAVFVDPGTGQVTGSLVTYGSSGALPLRMTLSQLHRNLMLGEPGRLYTELAASWLWVVALGGLILWITRRRPEKLVSGLKRTKHRHGLLGVWVLAGALFLSATGLTWSAYAGENIGDLRAALGWTTPSLEVASPGGDHSAHQPGSTSTVDDSGRVDVILSAARASGIDARGVEIGLPAKTGQAWKVTEIERGWPTQVDSVAIDGWSGRVLDQVSFSDYPFMAKLTRWGIDAHMGLLFGWVNQLLLVALGLGLVALVVLGYRMWWQRRPTGASFGRPVPRGQWRKAPRGAVIALAAGAAGVGWFVPLLGISLLAFLLIDGVLSRRREVSHV